MFLDIETVENIRHLLFTDIRNAIPTKAGSVSVGIMRGYGPKANEMVRSERRTGGWRRHEGNAVFSFPSEGGAGVGLEDMQHGDGRRERKAGVSRMAQWARGDLGLDLRAPAGVGVGTREAPPPLCA